MFIVCSELRIKYTLSILWMDQPVGYNINMNFQSASADNCVKLLPIDILASTLIFFVKIVDPHLMRLN